MTYCILSTESGDVLASYATEQHALEAAKRIHDAEPEADDSFAVVTYDDAGIAVSSLYGASLIAMLDEANAPQAAYG
ncbi:MAG: hypothetical protein ACXVZK_13515 [Gaiellaceae bacterium]